MQNKLRGDKAVPKNGSYGIASLDIQRQSLYNDHYYGSNTFLSIDTILTLKVKFILMSILFAKLFASFKRLQLRVGNPR